MSFQDLGLSANPKSIALWGLMLQEVGMAFLHHECHDPLSRAVRPQPQPNKVILCPATRRAGDRAVQCCLAAGDGTARDESHWPFLSSLYRWLPRCREGELWWWWGWSMGKVPRPWPLGIWVQVERSTGSTLCKRRTPQPPKCSLFPLMLKIPSPVPFILWLALRFNF